MPNLFLWTFFILTLFVSGCAASAQTNTPVRNYVYPTNRIDLYYQKPPSEVIIEFATPSRCAMGGAKAVENHNAFYKAMGPQPLHPPSYDIIGEHSFIKYVYCHTDLKTPGQFVVVLGLDTKERVEEYKKAERKTRALNHTYTFFDEKGNIVRWGR